MNTVRKELTQHTDYGKGRRGSVYNNMPTDKTSGDAVKPGIAFFAALCLLSAVFAAGGLSDADGVFASGESSDSVQATSNFSVLYGWPKIAKAEGEYIGVAMTGAPMFADLDTSHYGLEVISITKRGNVFAWHDDGTQVAGWPQSLGDGYTPMERNNNEIYRNELWSPVVADIDMDGQPELVAIAPAKVGYNASVYAFRANGTLLPGWPVALGTSINMTRIYNNTLIKYERLYFPEAPAIGDLDLPYPGLETVVVVVQEENDPSALPAQNITVHVLHSDGTEMAGWPKSLQAMDGSAPAIADIDNDGEPEIVASVYAYSSRPSITYVWKANGDAFPGWPVARYGRVRETPAVADVDPDYPGLEIITAGLYNSEILHSDGTVGAQLPANEISGPFSVADLDEDGTPEIIGVVKGTSASDLAVYSPSGHMLPGWPKFLFYDGQNAMHAAGPAAIADIDPNASGLEILAYGSHNKNLYAFYKNGSEVPGTPMRLGWSGVCDLGDSFNTTGTVDVPRANIAVADINGDGKLEIAVNSYCRLFVIATSYEQPLGAKMSPWQKFQRDLRNAGDYRGTLEPAGTGAHAVELLSPAGQAVLDSSSVALSYKAYVVGGEPSRCGVFVDGTLKSTRTSYTESAWRYSASYPNGNYSWQVKCHSDRSGGIESEVRQFSVNASAGTPCTGKKCNPPPRCTPETCHR